MNREIAWEDLRELVEANIKIHEELKKRSHFDEHIKFNSILVACYKEILDEMQSMEND